MTDETLPRTAADTQALVEQLNNKVHQLVEDFAKGKINRVQFQQLYDYYQRQLMMIADVAATLDKGSKEDTMQMRKKLTAKVQGISIYNNLSGMPIETLGDFSVDPALLVPMLSSYRAATREVFQAGMRSTAMENDQYLLFVPGNITTLMVLYSLEPSKHQLEQIERMHRDFETANQSVLERNQIDPSALAYPFLTFIRRAKSK